MKIDEIYFWTLTVISLILFAYGVTHIPESTLQALTKAL